MQLTLSGVMNIVQFVALIPTFLWLDKVAAMIGECAKQPRVYGGFAETLLAKYSNDWPAHQAQAWVGVAFIIFYMVPYGVGWGPIPWSLRA
jgi:hypothetical protein